MSSSPKAQLLKKVSNLEGAEARIAAEKAWDENTVKLLYQRNIRPPVSQSHADLLTAEEQWFDACKDRNYPWSGQTNTNGTSGSRHLQYFHYWFERKRLDEQANIPAPEGELNPLITADKHALAWQKVIAQEKDVLSKTTKKQLVVLHEGVKQQIQEAERLAWEDKKAAAANRERAVRKIEAERKDYRDLEKDNYNLEKENINLEKKYRELKNNLKHRGGQSDWEEQAITQSDADEQQRLIQANHIQDLKAKILALEVENKKLKDQVGKEVKAKKDESSSEDTQSAELKLEGGSRKRKLEEVSSKDESSDDNTSEDEC
ncbi:hypothetical protein PG988_011036 [Apiospora saccharicola]